MIDSSRKFSYDISASTRVAADPEAVFRVASDITRMGEWSPECTGGEWIQGEPGTVGSRFRGHNRRGEDTWTTECEVIAAEPGREFAWAVLTYAPRELASVWSFELALEDGGTLLTQRYRMVEPPARLLSFVEGLPDDRVRTFAEKRRAMLEKAMTETVAGIKAAVEQN